MQMLHGSLLQCTASNPMFLPVSSTIKLAVNFPPEVEIHIQGDTPPGYFLNFALKSGAALFGWGRSRKTNYDNFFLILPLRRGRSRNQNNHLFFSFSEQQSHQNDAVPYYALYLFIESSQKYNLMLNGMYLLQYLLLRN
jgi:hypothetical protein